MVRAISGAAAACMLFLSLSATVVYGMGIEHIVGDDKGWSLGVSGWEKDKGFHLGDFLVFNYDPKKHTVLEVSTKEYETCKLAGDVPSWRNFTSGHDYVVLIGGSTSFISGGPGDCERGMKIHVNMLD